MLSNCGAHHLFQRAEELSGHHAGLMVRLSCLVCNMVAVQTGLSNLTRSSREKRLIEVCTTESNKYVHSASGLQELRSFLGEVTLGHDVSCRMLFAYTRITCFGLWDIDFASLRACVYPHIQATARPHR